MGPEVRGVGLVHPGRGGHRGGRGAFLYLRRPQPRFAFPDLLFEEGEVCLGLQKRSGYVGLVHGELVVVLEVLGVDKVDGVCGRLGLRLLEAALVVVKGDA